MTVLLVLCMLGIFLIVDAVLQRMQTLKAVAQRNAALLAWPKGKKLAFNHTWLKEEKDGSYTLGLDAFLGNILGKLDDVMLPEPGTMVAPAALNIGLAQGGRMLQLSSPVSGRILEVNRNLAKDPSRILEDPYESGWFARIKPDADGILPGFFTADPQQWAERQSGKVREFFVSRLGGERTGFMQDGGMLINGILQHYDARVWDEFQKQFVTLPDTVSMEGRVSNDNR